GARRRPDPARHRVRAGGAARRDGPLPRRLPRGTLRARGRVPEPPPAAAGRPGAAGPRAGARARDRPRPCAVGGPRSPERSARGRPRGRPPRAARLARHDRDGHRPGRSPDRARVAAGPLGFAIGLAVFAAGLRFLALAVPVQRFLVAGEKALAIVAATWLVLRGLDVLVARFERRLDESRHVRAVATVPLGRRTLKVFVAVVAFIAALQNFGFNVTGLIAGLGVGGLAVALAAQKTVENLFGSVSLVADQPVRVGDVCRFGDTVGTVEDIGLRSTRVRTVDRTLVTIPNAQFSTLALDNLSQRDRIPVRAT